MLLIIRNSIKELIFIGNRNQLSCCLRLSCQVSIDHRRWASRDKQSLERRNRLMGLGNAVPRRGAVPNSPKRHKPTTNNRRHTRILGETLELNNTDWPSFFEAASSYNSNVIPLLIRMGRPKYNRLGGIPPSDRGNVELLKIPNFFHLTPPAIKKHCDVLKDYCTPWPEDAGYHPVRITTINFLYAGPSIRYPVSRKVKLQVYLKDLDLDDHSRRKFILLVGDRYNPQNGELTLITDKCPTRTQNKEYAYYLLTALYHESLKTHPWEEESIGKAEEEIDKEVEKVRTELYPRHYMEKKRHRRHYRVVNDKLVRFNRYGHPFVYEMRKYGIKGGLSEEELHVAKEEWGKIQKDLPDVSTFDHVYKSSFSSEFNIN